MSPCDGLKHGKAPGYARFQILLANQYRER
jgi:hypothetical protein